MEKRDFKRPRFTLDRSKRGNLAEQIAVGLRTAIETGYYRPGDILPPVRDLAEILGVSMGIAVQAVNRIREAGLISPRPAVGSVVCAKDRPLWNGQVLIIVPPGIGNPIDNVVYSVVRDRLISSGYLPLVASVPHDRVRRELDFALIDTMMRQQIELVVLLQSWPGVIRWLSKRTTPFAALSFDAIRAKNCVGVVRRRDDLVLNEFVEQCRRDGVKTVLEVRAMRTGPDTTSALKAIGIRATSRCIPPPDEGRDANGLVQNAIDEFAKRLKKGWKLPDLIFFRDDHLTTGALLALTAAGIRIPEDVRVVTWANRYYSPSYMKPLTRMEMDNRANGETLAKCVLEYLRTGEFPHNIVIGPKYVRGETF